MNDITEEEVETYVEIVTFCNLHFLKKNWLHAKDYEEIIKNAIKNEKDRISKKNRKTDEENTTSKNINKKVS